MFVDDLPGNLKPARAIGMATVVHRGDAAQTLAEVGEHLRTQPALIAATPASVATTPACCERLTRSASTNRASTTVTAG